MPVIRSYLEAGHGGSITIGETAPAVVDVVFDLPPAAVDIDGLAAVLQTALNASALNGTYTVTFATATGLFTIARTDGGNTFTLDLTAAAQQVLGFLSSSYVAATSRTSQRATACRLPCAGIDLGTPEAKPLHERTDSRHGRSDAVVWGAGRTWHLQAVYMLSSAPASMAWLTSGKVRVLPANDAAALSETNLDGSVLGSVTEHKWHQLDIGLGMLELTVVEV